MLLSPVTVAFPVATGAGGFVALVGCGLVSVFGSSFIGGSWLGGGAGIGSGRFRTIEATLGCMTRTTPIIPAIPRTAKSVIFGGIFSSCAFAISTKLLFILLLLFLTFGMWSPVFCCVLITRCYARRNNKSFPHACAYFRKVKNWGQNPLSHSKLRISKHIEIDASIVHQTYKWSLILMALG